MNEPFKRAVYNTYDRMVKESLGLVVLAETYIHLRPWAAKKLARSEEITTLCKSDQFWKCGSSDVLDCQEGFWLPNRLYGMRVYVPKTPAIRTMNEPDKIVCRIVPAAYLWWESQKEGVAWYAALEYVFS